VPAVPARIRARSASQNGLAGAEWKLTRLRQIFESFVRSYLVLRMNPRSNGFQRDEGLALAELPDTRVRTCLACTCLTFAACLTVEWHVGLVSTHAGMGDGLELLHGFMHVFRDGLSM